jgi:pimeloyl-ACP methyl ester carboxylesterase
VDELKNAAQSYDTRAVVSATLPREAAALACPGLPGLARAVTIPVLLLLGSDSPAWARDITGALASALPAAEQVTLPGQGHDAVDVAPGVLVAELERYLGSGLGC